MNKFDDFAEIFIDKVGAEIKISLRKHVGVLSKIKDIVFVEEDGSFRCLPIHYWEIVDVFREAGLNYKSSINENYKIEATFDRNFKLRDYQKEILSKLRSQNFRGLIVLPTGAGKTIIALQAIFELGERTLIVVPTIDLINQWRRKLIDLLGINMDKICLIGGGSFKVCDFTIATYVSASKFDFLRRYMDFFGLLIFDEAHHLRAKTYKEIPKRMVAPHRIGLTATMDSEYEDFFKDLLGGVIVGPKLENLVIDGYLEDFSYEKIFVNLSKYERMVYKRLMGRYLEILSMYKIKPGLEGFRQIAKRAKFDEMAKKALEYRSEAVKIALFPKEKERILEKVLSKHIRDKVIIFCRNRSVAYRISYRFCIPVITGEIDREERELILKMFRGGVITKIVSAEALDEGIDVPDANIAIIVSGRGSSRQMIQRIGRILRPKEGRGAKVYELVTKGTIDTYISKRRNIV